MDSTFFLGKSPECPPCGLHCRHNGIILWQIPWQIVQTTEEFGQCKGNSSKCHGIYIYIMYMYIYIITSIYVYIIWDFMTSPLFDGPWLNFPSCAEKKETTFWEATWDKNRPHPSWVNGSGHFAGNAKIQWCLWSFPLLFHCLFGSIPSEKTCGFGMVWTQIKRALRYTKPPKWINWVGNVHLCSSGIGVTGLPKKCQHTPM